MPLINTSVPNLIQGVSQQPDTLKYDGQCQEQINALSSVTDGLRKRPNTNLLRHADDEIGENAFVHSINRSESEKYILIITSTKLFVYNLDGSGNVSLNDGLKTSLTLSSYLNTIPGYGAGYLVSSNPRRDLRALTVGDTTFIVNKAVNVQMDPDNTSPALNEDEALIFVKQAGYDKKYEVSVLGTDAASILANTKDVTTKDSGEGNDAASAGSAENDQLKTDSGVIAQALSNELNSGISGLTTTVEGSTIKLVKTSSDPFNIKTKDGFADKGLGVVYKVVDDITDLPVVAPEGFEIKVRGDAELSEDDYYLKFETNEGLAQGTLGRGGWVETVKPGETISLDSKRMPHRLISENRNYFRLQAGTSVGEVWDTRKAGDIISNPNPSFVGTDLSPRYISNLFFYKNRLGLLSNDNVILSEAGQYGNFFRTTVTTLLDSGPIDVGVASSNVTNLEAAVGFQENLILFSNKGQFVLKGGDLLTPETVSINPITNFDQTVGVNPISLGSFIYFPFTRGNFSGLREFAVSATGDTYTAEEITSHVPGYIPKNIIDIAGSSNEDIIVVLSSDEKDTLYIYKYFWSGNQKILSSWCKFTLSACEIRGIEFIDSTLYIATDRTFGNHYTATGEGYPPTITEGKDFMLLSMVFTSGLPKEEDKSDGTNLGFVTHLDFRAPKKILASQTRLTDPDDAANTHLDYYPNEAFDFPTGSTSQTGARLKVIDRANGTEIPFTRPTVTINGVEHMTTTANELQFTATSADREVFVGVEYDMQYTFSEQIFKTVAGRGKSPTRYTRTKIKNGNLFFDNTAFFKVKVTPENRDTYTNEYTTQTVGDSEADRVNLDSGAFRFPVFTKPENTTITIENGTPYPSTFQGAEFESFAHARSNRYS